MWTCSLTHSADLNTRPQPSPFVFSACCLHPVLVVHVLIYHFIKRRIPFCFFLNIAIRNLRAIYQTQKNADEQKETSAHYSPPKHSHRTQPQVTLCFGAFQPWFCQYVSIDHGKALFWVGQQRLNISKCIWLTLITHLAINTYIHIYIYFKVEFYYT